jgi:hypothetical protein
MFQIHVSSSHGQYAGQTPKASLNKPLSGHYWSQFHRRQLVPTVPSASVLIYTVFKLTTDVAICGVCFSTVQKMA